METTSGEDGPGKDPIMDGLRKVMQEVLGSDPENVALDSRFKEDLNADSLDLVEAVMGVEEKFDISIPEEQLEGVFTVGGIHAVVEKLVQEQQG